MMHKWASGRVKMRGNVRDKRHRCLQQHLRDIMAISAFVKDDCLLRHGDKLADDPVYAECLGVPASSGPLKPGFHYPS